MRFDAANGDRGRVFLDGKLVDRVVCGETGPNGFVEQIVTDETGKALVNKALTELVRCRRFGNVELFAEPETT